MLGDLVNYDFFTERTRMLGTGGEVGGKVPERGKGGFLNSHKIITGFIDYIIATSFK